MSEAHGPGGEAAARGPRALPDAGPAGAMTAATGAGAASEAVGDRFAHALSALREDGAEALDPVGLHYLEALHRRTRAASGEPRRLLELRFTAALASAAQRLHEARAARERQDAARERESSEGQTGLASLRALNQRLRALIQDPADEGARAAELRALRRFRRSWSRISAENQVRMALERGPEQAGPLNSHMLVLRSLELMRALSPDYLQRFLSRIDTLLWLEQAEAPRPSADTRPARRARRRKDAPPAS